MEFATGEFVTFLDHDDTIEPDALECVAEAICRYPDADLLYTDEDKITVNGSHVEPTTNLTGRRNFCNRSMYIMHLFVIRKKLLLELVACASNSAAHRIMIWRCARQKKPGHIVHIPKILYHWRSVPGSAATHVDAKPQALLNARAALECAVRGCDPEARVLDGLLPGSFRVQWPVATDTAVTC